MTADKRAEAAEVEALAVSVAIKAQNPDLERAWQKIAWWEQTCDYWYEQAQEGYRLRDDLPRRLAEARAEALREALRVVRLVEADMSEAALKSWRSADARRGLSDHEALLVHADALTRWSERFRMAFDGEDYRDDRARAAAEQAQP